MSRVPMFAALCAGLLAMTSPAHAGGLRGGDATATQMNRAAVTEAATVTWSGSIITNFTITLKSGIPTTYPITCTVTVSTYDPSGLVYSVSKSVLATRSGSTAKCAVGNYYAWGLSSPAPTFNTSWSVDASGTGSLQYVQATGNLPTANLPTTGTSLTRSVATTI